MKKLFKIIWISVVALFALILLTLLFLSSSPGENLIKTWLEDRLSTEIGLPVTIAQFETNIWSRIRIDTITVNLKTGFVHQQLLYVGQIRIGYSIPELLGDQTKIRKLFIDSLDLSIELDSLGRLGVPVLDNPAQPSGDSAKKPTTMVIDTLSLNGITLYFLDPCLPLSVELDGAIMSATGNDDGSFSGLLKAESIVAGYDSLTAIIGNIDVSASMDAGMLKIEHATADLEGIKVAIAGELDLADTMSVRLTALAEGTPDSLLHDLASYFDFPQVSLNHASIDSRIDGNLDNLKVKLNADLNGFKTQGITVQSAALSASYYDNTVMIDTFYLSALKGKIAGYASVKPDTVGSYALNLEFDDIDLGALWRVLYNEESPYKGTLEGNVTAEGRVGDIKSMQAIGVITGKNLLYLDRETPDISCRYNLRSGRTAFSFVHGRDEITADLELGNESVSGYFAFSIPDITALTRIINQPDFSGSLNGRGTINGVYSNPAIRANVNGSKIAFRNFPIDTIFAELSYIDSSLTIIDLLCEGNLDSIDPYRPLLGLDSLGGSLAYECRLRGSRKNLSGEIKAHSGKPRYGSFELDSLSLEAALAGARLNITDFKAQYGDIIARLVAGYDTSSASGSFNLVLQPGLALIDTNSGYDHDPALERDSFGNVEGEFTFSSGSELSADIRGHGIWLGVLNKFMVDTVVSDGEIGFEASITGPYLTPDAIVKTSIRSLEVSEFRIDSISSQLRIFRDTLILDSLISYALGHQMRASGRLKLSISPDSTFEISDYAEVTARLSMTDFDLSVLKGLIVPEGDIKGSVSATLDLDGALNAPRLKGWLHAENGLILMDENSTPLENIGLSLNFADSILTIDSATGVISNIIVTLDGSLSASNLKSVYVDLGARIGQLGEFSIDGTVSETDINIVVNSDSLNLAVFQPFMTGVDSLVGRLDCRVQIEGEPAAPHTDGYLNARSLSLLMPDQKIRLADGQMAIRFDKSRIILDSAVALLNGGSIAVSGEIIHERGELQDLGLSVRAHAITLQEPGTYTLSIDSATLNFGKQQANYVLDGDIVLGEARLTAGLKPNSILPWVKSMETVDLELPELLARSRLDVRIRKSDQLWVDNNLAHLRIRAELGVIGTPLRPNFTGMLNIEEGYLLYLDRRFHVNEGTVYFVDPIRFNPDIKLNANTEVTVYRRTAAIPYTIFIKAEGLLDQLQYGVYSEPPLEKPDIVALLTLGATRAELSGKDGSESGGLTAALKDRAAMLTSKRISSYLSRKAGAMFGFEEFTIQGNLFDVNDDKGIQLMATKRLSRRIDLTYSTSVGHLNDQTMRLGYRLSSRFSLQGETDRQGRAGLDLKYGITFK